MVITDILKRSARPLDGKATLPAIVFLWAAFLGGGAGMGYPWTEAAIELLAIGMVARIALAGSLAGRDWTSRAILAAFAAVFVLALVQLVPLPPSVWQSLPERTIAVSVYTALGWSARWHALSLTPDRTLLDLLAVTPALASFMMMAALTERKRVALLRCVVAFAVIGTGLGALQVAAGAQAAPVLYETIHRGFGVGFFVNRNHQAAFLLVAIVLAAVPRVVSLTSRSDRDQTASAGAHHRRASLMLPLVCIAFLALGVLATTSRTGLALLPPALIVAVGLLIRSRGSSERSGLLDRYGLPAALIIYAAFGLALYPSSLVQGTLARFAAAGGDLRYQYWDNTRFALNAAMPWGTGFGSFDTIYRTVEPLGQVTPVWVNHAHNDYLELALEGGVGAILLMAAAIVVLGAAFLSTWRRATSSNQRVTAICGAAGVTVILLCSVVDFPLRMAALSAPFGLLLGLAVPVPARADRSGIPASDIGTEPRARPLHASLIVLGALVAGWLSLSGGLAVAFAQHDQPVLATTLAPWMAQGWSERANQEALAGRRSESNAAALRALAIRPLDAEAVRAVGLANLAARHDARGATLLQLGAALGWRDTPTQLWLVRTALQVGNLPVAVERIDGLLRRGVEQPLMQRQLRAIFVYPGGVEAIAGRLGLGAPWRQGFLNAIADDSPAAVPQLFALLRALREAGVPASSTETSLIRWRLANAGDFASARKLWLATGGSGWLANGDFSQSAGVLPEQAAPFAWASPPISGVHVTIAEPDTGASGRSAMIASDGYAAGPVLTQTVILPPGRFQLGFHIRPGAGGQLPPIGWTLTCLHPGQTEQMVEIPWRGVARDRAQVRGTGLLSIGSDCPAQRVSLTVRESSGARISFQVDAVRIERVIGRDGIDGTR